MSASAKVDVTLTTNERNRALVLSDLHNTLDDLSIEQSWSVHIATANETRRDIQNKLMHCWHRDWASHNGEPVGWAHGSTKLELLLPMKLGSDHEKTRRRAVFESPVLDCIPVYEVKVGVAYDLIRSKDIPVRLFAEFLSSYQVAAGQQGCILTSSKDQLDYALMREADSRA